MLEANDSIFECRDVHVFLDEKEIVKGVDLKVCRGEKHVLMGPNGSGKSTFAQAMMGHPDYRVEGEILLAGEQIGDLPPDERAKRGLFLGFQNPLTVPGVAVGNFLRAAVMAQRETPISVREFRGLLHDCLDRLNLDHSFAGRYLNDGFSGGEKKRLELVQLLLLQPRFALLDEIDSGLDIDAVRLVAEGIQSACDDEMGVLLVTHYQRLLDSLIPDQVHVFMDGKIVRSGGAEQSHLVEEQGYEQFQQSFT